MADKITKIEVVPPQVAEVDADEKKVLQAQYDLLTDQDLIIARTTLKDASEHSKGAPPAQGPNVSKEEAEFAANAAQNKAAEDVPLDKQAAPVQASSDPLVEAGKAVKGK